MDNNTQFWNRREPNPAKRYLWEYLTLVKRRDALLDELDRLREANQRATSRLTAVRLSGTSGHGGFEDGALRVVDGETTLRQVIAHIDECLNTRLVIIEQLKDERQKLVLTYRYIKGMGWDEIMDTMHYQRTQVWKLHGEALEEVRRGMKERTSGTY
ncbi:MAG: hypothetical protein PHY64_00335 [Eubacteriales bacterium]|nr:hypothetical protein [Eubacteriales bacterium]